MEQLKGYYETYIEVAEEVWRNRPRWDGVLGLKSEVRDHPCHTKFFNSVETWMEEFVKSQPTQAQAEEVVSFVLHASDGHQKEFIYFPMYAAHGMVRPLIDYVSPQFAAETLVWYNKQHPRRERMPVHQELFKLLKKRSNA